MLDHMHSKTNHMIPQKVMTGRSHKANIKVALVMLTQATLLGVFGVGKDMTKIQPSHPDNEHRIHETMAFRKSEELSHSQDSVSAADSCVITVKSY
jgi:hypothetical protein